MTIAIVYHTHRANASPLSSRVNATMPEQIMTVLGPIPADQLGVTHMHEHLIADCSFSGNDPRKKYDDVDVAIEEMRYLKEAGGDTLVELTSRGLGQDSLAL